MLNTLIFLALRVLHVLFAATWIGSTVFVSLLLGPAADHAGPSGGQVMAAIDRRGLHTYMAILAGTTVLTGVYLIWRFSGGFDSGVIATHAGIAFGTGGVAGVLALIVGASVVGRSARQTVDILRQATAMPDGPARSSLVQQATAARRRVKVGSKVVILLQAIALVLMTVGHYI
ncbi:MAG: hypothetical protein ACM3SQ_02495 [Betaproteobacteria bacterium]